MWFVVGGQALVSAMFSHLSLLTERAMAGWGNLVQSYELSLRPPPPLTPGFQGEGVPLLRLLFRILLGPLSYFTHSFLLLLLVTATCIYIKVNIFLANVLSGKKISLLISKAHAMVN